MNERRWAALLLSVCAVLGGCGTLPDARPFSEATVSLAASVVMSGRAITDSLVEAGGAVPGDAAVYAQLAVDFGGAWAHRIDATDAAVVYAESIADLVAAGSQGAATVDGVADALTTLSQGVGLSLTTPAVAAAGDAARLIHARIAVVRASDRLSDALAHAQPAIDRVAARIVAESEQQLRPILLAVHRNVQSGIKSVYEEDNNFAAQARKQRELQRQKVLRDPAALPRLQEYDGAQQTVDARLETRDRRLAQAAVAYRARLQLLNALASATLAWAQAHRDLAAAVRERRAVHVGELQDALVNLKALARKVGDL